ncbi:MAG: hypothetical protein ACI4K7_05260 [Oscillospiraceae bacterium]
MKMEKMLPIEDEILGQLHGRDCIFVSSVIGKDDKLSVSGEINGLLAEKVGEAKQIEYTLTFNGVIAYYVCELDTYLNADKAAAEHSDFDVVENSEWLESLPIRTDIDKTIYRHYRVFTYDNVYNIIAACYKMKCDFVKE